MVFTFLKRPSKTQISEETLGTQQDIKAMLIESTIAAVEGRWDIVEEKTLQCRLLLKHLSFATRQ